MSNEAITDSEDGFQARALELLEFPQVLGRLAGYAKFPLAKELALSLTPAYDPNEVQWRQLETSEAVRYLSSGKTVDLSTAKDVRDSLIRAAPGGKLNGAELLDVRDTVEVLESTRTIVGPLQELPILSSMARQIPDLRELWSQLSMSIGQGGKILDEASPQLGALRVQVREAGDRLEEHLRDVMRRLHTKGVLQEALITVRQGRMVLLVKSEMRQHVPGIIHDVSNSGATLFVEPQPTIPLGNRWHESRLAVEREEDRILWALSAEVGYWRDGLSLGIDVLARIDFDTAKAMYSISTDSEPAVVAQTERPYLRLTEARHPLLPNKVVPNTIELGDRWSIMLLTGPNAGGKTVALKMAGLLAAMAQAGLHVPAKEALISTFDGFYPDIGDQQSIQSSLSTFSSHIYNLGRILDHATASSLILIDELGGSTDPEEGAALAKAIILELERRAIPALITTHYRNVASFVQERPGMVNASVGLDQETLVPTYKLAIGLPESSYALTIATRLGMPQRVIDDARSHLSSGYLTTEGFLNELQREIHQATESRREVERELEQAQNLRLELEEGLDALERDKDRLIEEARRELQVKVEELWKRLRAIERVSQVPAIKDTTEVLKEQKQDVAALRNELKSPTWQTKTTYRQLLKPLRPGDIVHVRGISRPVEVLSAPGEDHELEIALGSMRARVSLGEIEGIAETTLAPIPITTVSRAPAESNTGEREIDLRGWRVEEAIEQLDRFLDRAVLGGLPSARIIHGIGTGVLRSALREYLAQHLQVASISAEENSHSDGATIVELA